MKYKTKYKRRSRLTIKATTLHYGHIGLLLLAPLTLTSKHLFRFTLLLKKAARRAEKTFRFFWLYVFPNLPLTRKSLGLRMGKGKGKRQTWMLIAKPGLALVEVKNLRLGRATHFLKQLQYRVNVPTKIIYASPVMLNVPLLSKKHVRVLPFW